MLTFYGYKNCSTCRKAKKMLTDIGRSYHDVDVTINPPTRTILRDILKSGKYGLRDLFNTSGQVYRQMNMKDKLKTLSEAEAIDLLAENGKLLKRPIVTDGKKVTVGFKEPVYKKEWM